MSSRAATAATRSSTPSAANMAMALPLASFREQPDGPNVGVAIFVAHPQQDRRKIGGKCQ
jgi:hypothetical protein